MSGRYFVIWGMPLEIHDPIPVAWSPVGENRWGYHQFPNLNRLPDGRILLTYADAEDASETHGLPSPAYVSHDEGHTWEKFTDTPVPLRPHYSITHLANGDCLVMPAQPYLDYAQEGLSLPAPVAEADVYGKVLTFRTAEAAPQVQQYFSRIPAQRWSSRTGEWTMEEVSFPLDRHLFWCRANSTVLARTFFERPLLDWEGELFYADYRIRYESLEGAISPKGGTQMMVSRDDGRSFQRRSVVMEDLSGQDLYGEAALALGIHNTLICVLRRTDQVQKPMAICWSSDRGYTWTPPVDLAEFGVFPCLETQPGGRVLLSYGRPGVRLRLAKDGLGKSWEEEAVIVPGSPSSVQADSCGYTNMLRLRGGGVLLAYSQFGVSMPGGGKGKVIHVQKVKTD